MRLQMHATDPVLLEPHLGHAESKGCIRIPARLNRFIDRYGLLDADYAAALARGETLWVLAPDRLCRLRMKASSTSPAGAAPVLPPQP